MSVGSGSLEFQQNWRRIWSHGWSSSLVVSFNLECKTGMDFICKNYLPKAGSSDASLAGEGAGERANSLNLQSVTKTPLAWEGKMGIWGAVRSELKWETW